MLIATIHRSLYKDKYFYRIHVLRYTWISHLVILKQLPQFPWDRFSWGLFPLWCLQIRWAQWSWM